MSARPIDFAPESPQAQAPAPRQLGKYVLSHVLGEGAMGIVYKAVDPLIHRPVAVKAIRAPLLAPGAHDLAAAMRFRIEAQAAGRLCHPNIVSVYEYGETAHERYIAMEFVDGVSLLELSRHTPRLPLDDALSLMLQLLDALDCAHAQGVWHRDIKPANLLITPDGRLKVSDFGIARIDSADRTHHTTVLGSPGYMAPERYTDEAPDQRVDLFSCGVLMYELLTGAPPFRGSSSAVMYQVLHQHPPLPSTLGLQPAVPARFDAVVQRALAKRPADRYASAALMREALLAAADRPIRPTLSVDTLLTLRRTRPQPATQVLPRPTVPSAPSLPSLPGIDRAALDTLEALLLPLLGPVARLVLRDAARSCHDLPALIAHVARQALDEDERPGFLARAAQRFPAAPAAPRSVPSRPLPVLGSTPMAPEVVAQARTLLAEEIGPLAGLIVKRAAAVAGTREQFYAALMDLAGDEVDRKTLLARLWKGC
ncbi:serine/threonine-protein kinase [Piscinibacter defluvii]|uniref:serine/threonine-protein kinase n=1 Tax=Piscinibacter defluvii TaxID=1796922 RepID=UPI000FDD5D76|nr:serine/threonine-protein kinase [Piscinibacter defluvii]